MPQENDRDYAELLLDELRREDELYTSRLNLFLVAESLLFVSYATFYNMIDIDKKLLGIMVLIGIGTTFIYSVILRRARLYIDMLQHKLESIYPSYQKLRDEKKSTKAGKGKANIWLWSISLIFLFAWILFLLIVLF